MSSLFMRVYHGRILVLNMADFTLPHSKSAYAIEVCRWSHDSMIQESILWSSFLVFSRSIGVGAIQHESDVGLVFPTFEWVIPASVDFLSSTPQGVWSGLLAGCRRRVRSFLSLNGLSPWMTSKLGSWPRLGDACGVGWSLVGWFFSHPIGEVVEMEVSKVSVPKAVFFFEKSRFGWFDHGIKADDFGSANFMVRHHFQWKEAMITHNLELLSCSDLVHSAFSSDILWICHGRLLESGTWCEICQMAACNLVFCTMAF